MKFNYVIFILFIVIFAKAILVDTPRGKRLDFSRLPHIGSELTRSFESMTRGLFKLANKCGLQRPPSIGQWFDESHNKREATIRQRNSDGWSAVNVTDPAQIQVYVEIWGPHPEGPRKLGDWRSALGCSVSEANQWRELSPDLPRLVEWKKEGMSPEDTAGWFPNPRSYPTRQKTGKVKDSRLRLHQRGEIADTPPKRREPKVTERRSRFPMHAHSTNNAHG